MRLVVAANAAVVATQAASAAVEATVATGTGGVASFITTTVPSMVASVLPSGATTTAANAARIGAVTVPVAWDLLATFAGALSGGLAAVKRKFDITGVLTLAIVVGMGGGIVRDVLLQRFGIAAFSDNRYLLVAVIAATVAFFFAGAIKRLATPMLYISAVSLGLFVIVGSDKALRADMTMLPAIMFGVITATGGGLLRDLLSREVPQILKPGALYSTVAVLGATVYVLSVSWLGVVKEFAALFAIAFTVGLRLLAMWRGWQGPEPRDYSATVAAHGRRLLSYTLLYSPPRDRSDAGADAFSAAGRRPLG
jgi:uncharacterized membrane protein YeiH